MSMAVYGSAWQCMAVHGSAWQRMAVHGSAWQRMAVHGSAWQCMAVHGSACSARHAMPGTQCLLKVWPRITVHGHGPSTLPFVAGLATEWQDMLEMMATRAAASLAPAVNSSINSILKIKTLQGGQRDDSHYIDGLVCRQNIAIKKYKATNQSNAVRTMPTDLENPRILLLACPLEHERISFTSSLEALRQQEEEHMGMIIKDMCHLDINLLLVGGSICHTAREKLMNRNIVFAVGVKPSVLAAVASCCKTQVLLSPEQVLGTVPGSCGRWRVEKSLKYMYFEGCDPKVRHSVA